MKNKGLIATIVVMSAVIITLIVILLVMQMSSIGSLTDILNPKNKQTAESIVESSIVPTTEEIIETTVQLEIGNITSETKTYTSHNGRVSIDYPVISGIEDSNLQNIINEKLYNNAISIVKLYPISTALQRLTLTCDVKTLNEDVITVLYEGRVVGDDAKGSNVNRISPVTNNSSTSSNKSSSDPYLDGFIDPLAGNNYIPPTISYETISQTPSVSVYDNSNATNKAVENKNNTSTSDTGPSVANPITPTAKSRASSNNNQANVINSSTVVNSEYSSNNVYNNPNANGSNLPISSSAKTETKIQGYTGTSLSASTIDQRIFFTNSIDLKTGKNLTLKDYTTDFEKLAKYARSSDVEFTNIDDSNKNEVRTYIRKTVLSKLTEHLEKNSDFRDEGVKNWPKHFSYRDTDGTIYFTIKLSSKLGNYAIIKYKN